MEENTHVIEITPEQFSTMQHMFRTQVPMQMNLPQTSSESGPECETMPKEINPLDFSTMQMMFATNNMSMLNQPPVSSSPLTLLSMTQETETKP